MTDPRQGYDPIWPIPHGIEAIEALGDCSPEQWFKNQYMGQWLNDPGGEDGRCGERAIEPPKVEEPIRE